jgi:hypothetical protein
LRVFPVLELAAGVGVASFDGKLLLGRGVPVEERTLTRDAEGAVRSR